MLGFHGENGRSEAPIRVEGGPAKKDAENGRSDALTRGEGGPAMKDAGSWPFEGPQAFRARVSVRRLRRNGNGRVGSQLAPERWGPVQELQLELDRSRRFGHPFALVGIWCRPTQRDRWTFLREVAGSLNGLVRRVDRVWIQGSGVFVLLPECDRTKLEATLARLRDPVARLLGEDARAQVSSAVFPDDGLTSGALLDALARGGQGETPAA
jgi:hypothetical protein